MYISNSDCQYLADRSEDSKEDPSEEEEASGKAGDSGKAEDSGKAGDSGNAGDSEKEDTEGSDVPSNNQPTRPESPKSCWMSFTGHGNNECVQYKSKNHSIASTSYISKSYVYK